MRNRIKCDDCNIEINKGLYIVYYLGAADKQQGCMIQKGDLIENSKYVCSNCKDNYNSFIQSGRKDYL